jgi:hypothetical protein
MGVSGQHHTLAALYPRGKNPWYPLDGRLTGPRASLDAETRKKKSSASVRDWTPFVQSVVSHFSDWATPTHLWTWCGCLTTKSLRLSVSSHSCCSSIFFPCSSIFSVIFFLTYCFHLDFSLPLGHFPSILCVQNFFRIFFFNSFLKYVYIMLFSNLPPKVFMSKFSQFFLLLILSLLIFPYKSHLSCH